MAEKAQAEPTMEEILASIRKIIADDSDAPPSRMSRNAPEPKVSVELSDADDFDDLSLDEVMQADEPEQEQGADIESLARDASEQFHPIDDEADDSGLLTDVDEEMFEELTAPQPIEEEVTPDLEPELEDFDLDAVDLDNEEPFIEEPSSDWTVGAEVELEEIQPAPAPELEKALRQQSDPVLRGKTEAAPAPAPAAPAAASSAGITDERIAGAAASALGKLMVKQSAEAGNPNTLEGLMMEMLRPMLKEWLDANLPAIVERKVEEEVRRIARMAG